MKYLNPVVLFVVMLCLAAISKAGDPVRSSTHEISEAQQLKAEFSIQSPTVFSLLNERGAIRIRAVDTPHILVSGTYRGKKPSKLIFTEAQPGKIKIAVEYPESSRGSVLGKIRNFFGGTSKTSSGVSVSGTGINLKGIKAGNISVVNGRVFIDGKEVDKNGNALSGESVGTESVDLEVAIPRALLSHLRAETNQGNLEVNGFSVLSSQVQDRIILLRSDQGEITLRDVVAPSGILAKTCQGGICVSQVQGNLELTSDQGDLFVMRSNGSVYAKTSQGKISVTNVEGILQLSTNQGNVDATNGTGDVTAKTEMGNVSVVNRKGNISGKSGMGNVSFSNPESISEFAKTELGNVRGVRPAVRCAQSLTQKVIRNEINTDEIFNF